MSYDVRHDWQCGVSVWYRLRRVLRDLRGVAIREEGFLNWIIEKRIKLDRGAQDQLQDGISGPVRQVMALPFWIHQCLCETLQFHGAPSMK